MKSESPSNQQSTATTYYFGHRAGVVGDRAVFAKQLARAVLENVVELRISITHKRVIQLNENEKTNQRDERTSSCFNVERASARATTTCSSTILSFAVCEKKKDAFVKTTFVGALLFFFYLQQSFFDAVSRDQSINHHLSQKKH